MTRLRFVDDHASEFPSKRELDDRDLLKLITDMGDRWKLGEVSRRSTSNFLGWALKLAHAATSLSSRPGSSLWPSSAPIPTQPPPKSNGLQERRKI